MPRRKFSLRAPEPFDFELTVRSHGWYDLPPFLWDPQSGTLRYALEIGDDVAVAIAMAAAPGGVKVLVDSEAPLERAELGHVKRAVVAMLRLDEDLTDFYRSIAADPALGWAARRGGGRILRSATAFEDIVKIICTTNCTWSLTRSMVSNLVNAAGAVAPGGRRAFPGPRRLARKTESFYRDKMRAGYRAPYLRDLSRAVARGDIEPDGWRRFDGTAAQLRKQLLALPGVGPYAAAHLLRMMGHYCDPGIDSWCRARFRELHDRQDAPTDNDIAGHYADYGEFAGLALWLDLTADWHEPANDGAATEA